MADTTLPRPRQDDPLPRSAPEAVAPLPEAARLRSPRAWLVVLWGAIIVGLAGFLIFGTVRIGVGHWMGRRMPVREIWSRFLGYLSDQGAQPIVVGAVVAAAAMTLVGAGYALWLAFALTDAPVETPLDESA